MWIDEICQESNTFAEDTQNVNKMKLSKKKDNGLGENPFLRELTIEATTKVETGKFVKADDGTLIPAHVLMEKQKYVRLYRLAGAKDRAMNLSATGSKMLLYILYTIEGSSDSLKITPEQYATATENTSRNTYKKGIEELWRYGYITPTVKKYIYWINPSLMFGANRITKWPEKVKIKAEM